MLVNIHHDSTKEHVRLLVLGVVFTVLIVSLLGLSLAIYQKMFTQVTMITIKADRAGQQLAKFGDVRLHGALVGQVRSVTQNGKEAVIKVALQPEAAKSIPENVSVEILPTTLFGQKFISLIDPKQPSSKMMSNGYVIPASRVSTNVELAQILANLYPMLRAIRPADLNTTLTALATGLVGRGEQLGQTMEDLDSYLSQINQHLPTVRQDLVLLARVSKVYSLAAPDLVRLLGNATTTAKTVTTMETQLSGFFTGLTTLSRTARRVLSTNETAIVREGQLSVPLLRMLDTYSPEFPCLFKGTAKYTKNLDEIFAGGAVAQTMDLSAKQHRVYGPQDKPEYGDIGRGPSCSGLPSPPVPIGYLDLKNGSDLDAPP